MTQRGCGKVCFSNPIFRQFLIRLPCHSADRPEILLAGDEEFKYRKGKHASVPSNQPDILLAGDEEFKFRGKHSHHQHHHHHHHKMGAETKDAGNGKGNERT